MTTATTTPNYSRKTLRKLGRVKRMKRLKTEPEFAKAYFEGRSKRALEKKATYKKKLKGKK